jgi:hypothetical protein
MPVRPVHCCESGIASAGKNQFLQGGILQTVPPSLEMSNRQPGRMMPPGGSGKTVFRMVKILKYHL